MTSLDLDLASARGGHAVVVGASIAGLLAARALSDAFTRVTVIDRDALPDAPETRRGVPQSRQVHGLLARGAEALDELFPGFSDDMIAAGAAHGDSQADFRWYLDTYPLALAQSGIRLIGLTRRRIERMIRARVAALPGVEITDSAAVTGLVASDGRVTAARVRHAGAAEESVIGADLVVDAAGRGSRAAAWLRELGFPEPATSEVHINVVYVTRHYQFAQILEESIGAAVAPFPGQRRGGLVMRVEGGQFAVVIAGVLGDEPPTDDEGMLAFAESLHAPQIAEVIRSAKPLDDPAKMRYPASVRHHYEKLDRYLDGFLVTGDALCSFNPVYGQGMTVAALEALTLRRLLAEGTDRLAPRFFRAVASTVDGAWSVSVGGDLRFAQVEGERPPFGGLVDRYLDRYRAAASVDPVLGKTFLRVTNLIDPSAQLMAPGHMLRVFRAASKATRR